MIDPMESKGRPTGAASREESLRALVVTDFEGNQQATAKALGVSRATVNQLINGHKGPGQPVMDGLVAYLRRPIEEIIAAGGDLAALRAPKKTSARSVEVLFGALPGWSALLEGARAIDPTLPEWCWRELAETRVWTRVPVTSSMVAEMGRFILRHVAPPGA